MTTQQLATLNVTLRRIEAKLDAVEERLAFVYPTNRELREQLDAEVDSILGCGVNPFAD